MSTPPLARGSWRSVTRPRPPVTIWVVVAVMIAWAVWSNVNALTIYQGLIVSGSPLTVVLVLWWVVLGVVAWLLLRGARWIPYLFTALAAVNLLNVLDLARWESWLGLALAAAQMVALWHPASRAYLREARAWRQSRVEVRTPA